MVALFRIAKYGPSTDGSDVIAGVLLAITLLASIASRGFVSLPTAMGHGLCNYAVFYLVTVDVFSSLPGPSQKNR